MDLDIHDSETIQPASTLIPTSPEEERMTSTTSQVARAVGKQQMRISIGQEQEVCRH